MQTNIETFTTSNGINHIQAPLNLERTDVTVATYDEMSRLEKLDISAEEIRTTLGRRALLVTIKTAREHQSLVARLKPGKVTTLTPTDSGRLMLEYMISNTGSLLDISDNEELIAVVERNDQEAGYGTYLKTAAMSSRQPFTDEYAWLSDTTHPTRVPSYDTLRYAATHPYGYEQSSDTTTADPASLPLGHA